MLDTLATDIRAAAQDLGVPAPLAERLAERVTDRIRTLYGGCETYIAARRHTRADLLHAIATRYTGANRDAICQEYGISRRTFYRLLNLQSD